MRLHRKTCLIYNHRFCKDNSFHIHKLEKMTELEWSPVSSDLESRFLHNTARHNIL